MSSLTNRISTCRERGLSFRSRTIASGRPSESATRYSGRYGDSINRQRRYSRSRIGAMADRGVDSKRSRSLSLTGAKSSFPARLDCRPYQLLRSARAAPFTAAVTAAGTRPSSRLSMLGWLNGLRKKWCRRVSKDSSQPSFRKRPIDRSLQKVTWTSVSRIHSRVSARPSPARCSSGSTAKSTYQPAETFRSRTESQNGMMPAWATTRWNVRSAYRR